MGPMAIRDTPPLLIMLHAMRIMLSKSRTCIMLSTRCVMSHSGYRTARGAWVIAWVALGRVQGTHCAVCGVIAAPACRIMRIALCQHVKFYVFCTSVFYHFLSVGGAPSGRPQKGSFPASAAQTCTNCTNAQGVTCITH
jgi:hypothetical protein